MGFVRRDGLLQYSTKENPTPAETITTCTTTKLADAG